MTNETAYRAGVTGEELAEKYLAGRGMTPVTRRYRGLDGEVDLILRDGETLVFVEVKYRPKGAKGSGLTAVTPAKRRRLIHAAAAFATEREEWDRPFRFDVVEISREGILHVPNAFQMESSYR